LELQWEALSDHWGMPAQLLVFPPAVPLVGTNCRNVSSWSPSSELEVVSVDWVHPLPGPAQHVEQLEEGIGRKPTNISQKWMKIVTKMKDCGDRC
jgi:hypothetical protein